MDPRVVTLSSVIDAAASLRLKACGPHSLFLPVPPLAPIYRLAAPRIGPAILIQDVSTVVVEPGCTATVTPHGDVAIEVGDVGSGREGGGAGREARKRVGTALDPVFLAIFAHRFMGIAEQMGRTLQVLLGGVCLPLSRPWSQWRLGEKR